MGANLAGIAGTSVTGGSAARVRNIIVAHGPTIGAVVVSDPVVGAVVIGAATAAVVALSIIAISNHFNRRPERPVRVPSFIFEDYRDIPPPRYDQASSESRREQSERDDIQNTLTLEQLRLHRQTEEVQPEQARIQARSNPIEARTSQTPDARYAPQDAVVLKWLRDAAKENLDLDFENYYNICIAGRSGVGKSTLINGLRGLKQGDPGAAAVHEKECATKMTKYPHPNAKYLILWDCPGSDTQKHPRETYFYDKFLFGFDFFGHCLYRQIRRSRNRLDETGDRPRSAVRFRSQ